MRDGLRFGGMDQETTGTVLKRLRYAERDDSVEHADG